MTVESSFCRSGCGAVHKSNGDWSHNEKRRTERGFRLFYRI
ncbi:hypothetical protein QWZ13_03230 [Reinekea marina]|nr:hypothetical protein [Reinekea marina]MDN3647924.1 hypothetical protein [Reinekea marina]